MPTFEIKADTAEVKARLKRQLDILREKRTPLSQMATQLYRSVQTNFKEQGTDRKPWKALKASTLYAKAHRKHKRTTSPLILQDTGHLRNSVYPEVGDDYARASTNVPYAAPLHFGTKDHTLPARPFVIIRKNNREAIINIARRWVFEGGK
jgi:phage virion morphogenesis protein